MSSQPNETQTSSPAQDSDTPPTTASTPSGAPTDQMDSEKSRPSTGNSTPGSPSAPRTPPLSLSAMDASPKKATEHAGNSTTTILNPTNTENTYPPDPIRTSGLGSLHVRPNSFHAHDRSLLPHSQVLPDRFFKHLILTLVAEDYRFLNPLLRVSSAFYQLASWEYIWMKITLILSPGDFHYERSWRWTCRTVVVQHPPHSYSPMNYVTPKGSPCPREARDEIRNHRKELQAVDTARICIRKEYLSLQE